MKVKELWKGKWVSVISPEEFPYECLHEPDIVIVLPIKDNKIGIRHEFCPPYMIKGKAENYYTVVTGKIEDGESVRETCVRELKEEAGIIFTNPKMSVIYSDLPVCKSTNMRATCVIVTGDEYEEVKATSDGTYYEKKSTMKWYDILEFASLIKNSVNIDVLLFNAFFYVLPYLQTSKLNFGNYNTLAEVGDGMYQLDNQEIPLEATQVEELLKSLQGEEKGKESFSKLQVAGSIKVNAFQQEIIRKAPSANESTFESGTFWDTSNPAFNDYSALYKEYVPATGEASTEIGELLRVVSNVYYDLYNNGFANLPMNVDVLRRNQDKIAEYMEDPQDIVKFFRFFNKANNRSNFYLDADEYWPGEPYLDAVIEAVVLYAKDYHENQRLTTQSNTGVIVDLYEVEYAPPDDPMKTTQELAKSLNEKEDFITQYLFPDSTTRDIQVNLRNKSIKKPLIGGLIV